MSYRQKHNGRWTEWSKSEVEVGDCVIHGYYEQSMIVAEIEYGWLTSAWKNGERYVFMVDEIRSRNPHGDPRRHPRFVPVPNVPQFPATEEGREMAFKWGRSKSSNCFVVSWRGGEFKGPDCAYGTAYSDYRIRRIGETVDYPLFVEVQNG